MSDNYEYMRQQTLGLLKHHFSTRQLRQEALQAQCQRIQRNLDSGDLTKEEAHELLHLIMLGS